MTVTHICLPFSVQPIAARSLRGRGRKILKIREKTQHLNNTLYFVYSSYYIYCVYTIYLCRLWQDFFNLVAFSSQTENMKHCIIIWNYVIFKNYFLAVSPYSIAFTDFQSNSNEATTWTRLIASFDSVSNFPVYEIRDVYSIVISQSYDSTGCSIIIAWSADRGFWKLPVH